MTGDYLCRECGADFGQAVVECPDCGKPPPPREVLAETLALLGVILSTVADSSERVLEDVSGDVERWQSAANGSDPLVALRRPLQECRVSLSKLEGPARELFVWATAAGAEPTENAVAEMLGVLMAAMHQHEDPG